MANKNNGLSQRRLSKRLDSLKTTMNDLYSATYATRPDNRADLDRISNSIEDNLDNLIASVNGQNVSDISNLIMRLQKSSGNAISEVNSRLEGLVTDSNLINNINMEGVYKYIQAENYQYDLILKYVPKLYQALEVLKDNVLSSDNFTKDFINAVGNKSNDAEANTFSSRARKLIDKYNIQELFEEMYMKTSIYGEYFLYQVPYKIAFERLMARKQAPIRTEAVSGITEDNNILTECKLFDSKTFKGIFHESIVNGKITKQNELSDNFMKTINESNVKVNISMDPYGIISEAIEDVEKAYKASKKFTSLSEAFLHEVDGQDGSGDWHRGVATYTAGVALSHDGMFGPASGELKQQKIKDMSGCVMYEIPRENIIPLYISNYCIGYYYFRIFNDYVSQQVLTANTFNSLTATNKIIDDEFERQNDMLVSHIAAQLSEVIDSKFINANVDLKEEIYAILRHNDQFNMNMGINSINVCFLPATDVHHFYFEFDKKRHRGVSDLKNAVVPAMLYALLYLTDIINKVSRSQDKRIYYVKQNIETNVARTMLNVIQQIKKGNMGMRQLENMNTIFNVIGKYNDFVIPLSQSGDAPVQFEVMQGQSTETPTDLMNSQEEAAVNSTDVPYEFVQSVNQVDFATRFTMSNSKFLRKVFKRQFRCQKHFTQIFRKLYNFEYNENESNIEIMLPAPAFLTMTNSQQLINNIKEFANAIAEIEISGEDELKPEFVKLMARNYLGSYVDFDKISKLVEKARQNLNIETTKKEPISDALGGDEGGDEL